MTPEQKKEFNSLRNSAYQKKWYRANREKKIQQVRAWTQENKDHKKAYDKARYQAKKMEKNKDGQ